MLQLNLKLSKTNLFQDRDFVVVADGIFSEKIEFHNIVLILHVFVKVYVLAAQRTTTNCVSRFAVFLLISRSQRQLDNMPRKVKNHRNNRLESWIFIETTYNHIGFEIENYKLAGHVMPDPGYALAQFQFFFLSGRERVFRRKLQPTILPSSVTSKTATMVTGIDENYYTGMELNQPYLVDEIECHRPLADHHFWAFQISHVTLPNFVDARLKLASHFILLPILLTLVNEKTRNKWLFLILHINPSISSNSLIINKTLKLQRLV